MGWWRLDAHTSFDGTVAMELPEWNRGEETHLPRSIRKTEVEDKEVNAVGRKCVAVELRGDKRIRGWWDP